MAVFGLTAQVLHMPCEIGSGANSARRRTMYSSRTKPTNGTFFPGIVQPIRPVVHFLTDDGSERAALDSTLSSAGFRTQAFACAKSFPTPPDVLEPTCLV
ncbi:MAG TPA: hypothetical protein VFO32_04100, partial [Sphingomicrobium sp.]|nr:hypothetical protein [Sphingomicrobium sp.]